MFKHQFVLSVSITFSFIVMGIEFDNPHPTEAKFIQRNVANKEIEKIIDKDIKHISIHHPRLFSEVFSDDKDKKRRRETYVNYLVDVHSYLEENPEHGENIEWPEQARALKNPKEVFLKFFPKSDLPVTELKRPIKKRKTECGAIEVNQVDAIAVNSPINMVALKQERMDYFDTCALAAKANNLDMKSEDYAILINVIPDYVNKLKRQLPTDTARLITRKYVRRDLDEVADALQQKMPLDEMLKKFAFNNVKELRQFLNSHGFSFDEKLYLLTCPRKRTGETAKDVIIFLEKFVKEHSTCETKTKLTQKFNEGRSFTVHRKTFWYHVDMAYAGGKLSSSVVEFLKENKFDPVEKNKSPTKKK